MTTATLMEEVMDAFAGVEEVMEGLAEAESKTRLLETVAEIDEMLAEMIERVGVLPNYRSSESTYNLTHLLWARALIIEAAFQLTKDDRPAALGALDKALDRLGEVMS